MNISFPSLNNLNSCDSYKVETENNFVKSKRIVIYRYLKTVILILGWISLGFTNEIIGPTLEDLRILMKLNYQQIATCTALKTFGFLIGIWLSSIFLRRLSNYANFVIALSSFFMGLRN
jgi:hypothetical protein